MQTEFPLRYTLDDGTDVTVDKAGEGRYEFHLQPAEGAEQRFAYRDDEEWTEAKEATLSFDQLNALRRFWLETRNEE